MRGYVLMRFRFPTMKPLGKKDDEKTEEKA